MNKKYLLYGGVGVLALLAGYWYISRPSAADVSSADSGYGAIPLTSYQSVPGAGGSYTSPDQSSAAANPADSSGMLASLVALAQSQLQANTNIGYANAADTLFASLPATLAAAGVGHFSGSQAIDPATGKVTITSDQAISQVPTPTPAPVGAVNHPTLGAPSTYGVLSGKGSKGTISKATYASFSSLYSAYQANPGTGYQAYHDAIMQLPSHPGVT